MCFPFLITEHNVSFTAHTDVVCVLWHFFMMVIVYNDFPQRVDKVGLTGIREILEAEYSFRECANFTQSIKSVCNMSK
jgi:hypothetical protein